MSIQRDEFMTHKVGDDPTLTLARNIVRLRKERGWRQGDLAREANISQATLSRIEGGVKDAHVSTLVRLARALDVSCDVLLTSPT